MQHNDFVQLMQQNRQPSIDLLPELEQLTTDHPWFSIAYQLRLKVLKSFDEELFANQLPLTAAHTINREQLHRYLHTDKPATINEDSSTSVFYYQPDEVDIPVPEVEPVTTVAKDDETPIEATVDYFALDEEAVAKNAAARNEELLAKFIAESPKITPRQQEEENGKEIKLAESTNGIASESLAQIYTQQRLYGKALAVYKELSLQNPEKRAYFAALIKKVKEEIK